VFYTLDKAHQFFFQFFLFLPLVIESFFLYASSQGLTVGVDEFKQLSDLAIILAIEVFLVLGQPEKRKAPEIFPELIRLLRVQAIKGFPTICSKVLGRYSKCQGVKVIIYFYLMKLTQRLP
jgi:hypothetical protein